MAVAARVLPAPVRTRTPEVRLARSAADLRSTLALRYRVFVEEMGAHAEAGDTLEQDSFDAYCQHLLVIDPDNGELLASTRLLDSDGARRVGAFYSESEFDLARVLALPGRFLEIGRTCVAPEVRQGAVIAALWSGIGARVRTGGHDHLIGCASIDARDGLGRARALYDTLRADQFSAADRRVSPHKPIPREAEPSVRENRVFSRPPLLKAYLRLGATVGGPPCLDAEFGVADLFMHLQIANLCPRYARHFLHRSHPAAPRPPVAVC